MCLTFSRLLDSLRSLFVARDGGFHSNPHAQLLVGRRAGELRTVLLAVRHMYRSAAAGVRLEHRAELWSRTLLFLRAVSNALLKRAAWPGACFSWICAENQKLVKLKISNSRGQDT